MSFILVGFSDRNEYESDNPAWDGDDLYETRDDAYAAADEWLARQSGESCVEVIELSSTGQEGLVRRVVTQSGYEDLIYPGNADPW